MANRNTSVDEIDLEVAGNTKRSDGELVGQFISSCRLSVGALIAAFVSSPPHNAHTTHREKGARNIQPKRENEKEKKGLSNQCLEVETEKLCPR